MPAINRNVSGEKMGSLQIGGLLYLVIINCWGFAAMGWDKRKAQKQAWRTPEKHLFLLAALGGSVGVWLGMQTFRHKTQHKSFTIGIPFILAVQIVLAIVLVKQGSC